MIQSFFKTYIFAISIVCFSFIKADTSPIPLIKSSLLWKIESQNSKNESYIFGTMHLIEKENFFFPAKLKKIVSNSDLLLMELPEIPSQTDVLKAVTLKDGSFFDFFNDKQIDTLIQWAEKELKMNQQTFRGVFYKMKPFVVLQMATQLQFTGKTESYEEKLISISKNEKIETSGLETIEQQINFFDELSKKEQAEMVMESIRNQNKSNELLKKMQKVYIEQNIDSLYLLFQEDTGIFSTKQINFLDNRNIEWIPKIKEVIKAKKCFIAVGAGHLGGPNGLIRLLQKEGYTLTPIEL